jgi:hypothetical protein
MTKEDLQELLHLINPEYTLTDENYNLYIEYINSEDYEYDLSIHGWGFALYYFFMRNNLKSYKKCMQEQN